MVKRLMRQFEIEGEQTLETPRNRQLALLDDEDDDHRGAFSDSDADLSMQNVNVGAGAYNLNMENDLMDVEDD